MGTKNVTSHYKAASDNNKFFFSKWTILFIAFTFVITSMWLASAPIPYKGNGYIVTPPSKWETIHPEIADVAFLEPLDTQNQNFRSNINIVIAKGHLDVSVNGEQCAVFISELEQKNIKFDLLYKNDQLFNNFPVSLLIYDITYGETRLRVSTYLIARNNTFIVSLTTLQGVHDNYSRKITNLINSLEEN